MTAFCDLSREHGFEPLRIEGTLPRELAGTVYRCGPALFSYAGQRYAHPFDGDGAVTAVELAHGRARGAVRLVDTPARRAGIAPLPGYGTLANPSAKRIPHPMNTANTSVLAWDDRVFALHEASPPTEIDPATIATLGETDLGLAEIRDGFSAHPRAVPARETWFSAGVRYGAQNTLELFELRHGAARSAGRIALPGATMIHDFAATERHLVFFAPPLRLRAAELLAGRIPFGDAFDWCPRFATEIIVVPIGEPVRTIRIDHAPFFAWHVANAFERGPEIIVDFVRYPDFGTNHWLASLLADQPCRDVELGTLARATINAAARTCRIEALAAGTFEYPRADGTARPHRFVYGVTHSAAAAQARTLHDQIARIDAQTGASTTFDTSGTPSEPVLIPGGWIAVLVHGAPSHLAVFDAERIEAGPVARAWFDHAIPLTFHGTWSPAR